MCLQDHNPPIDEDINIWVPGDHEADDLIALKARPKLDYLSNMFIDGYVQDILWKTSGIMKRQFKVYPYTPGPYSYKARHNDHLY